MELIVKKDYEEMSRKAANFILETMRSHPNGLFCFAGGDTPVRTLQLLVEEHEQGNIDLRNYYYIQLDEWVGLDEEDAGSCIHYLNEHFFHPAGIEPSHIHTFRAKEDLDRECEAAEGFVQRFGSITLSLLGIGVNGHVGFNEPGMSWEKRAHVVTLEPETKEVGQKYFKEQMELNQGITLGMQTLLDSEYIVLVANGVTKREAVQHLLGSSVPEKEWPVTAVRIHSRALAIIDEQAIYEKEGMS